MKRWISMLMILAMLLGLAACGGEIESVPPVEEENKTEVTTPADPAPDMPEEMPEEVPGAEPVLQLQRGDHCRVEQEETTHELLCEVRWESLLLTPESAEHYPELADRLRIYSDKTYAVHVDMTEELAQLARETLPEVDTFHGYTATTRHYIHRADDSILSIRIHADEYAGGAHPNYGTSALNYDPATGEEIDLADVVGDLDLVKVMIADKVRYKYPYEEFDGLEEQLEEYNSRDFTWTLDHQGITFWFSPYEIAPYAAGAPSATITFAELPRIFNEKYSSAADSWTVEMPLHQEVEIALQGDKKEHCRLAGYEEDNGFLDLYLVVGEENEYRLEDIMAYDVEGYMAYTGEQFFLFVEGVADSDYRTLYVYRLGADGPVLTDTVEGGFVGQICRGGGREQIRMKRVLTDPTHIELSSVVQLLGTWTGTKAYTFDPAAGTFAADSEVYTIMAERAIHTSAEIEVDIGGKTEKLPVGSELWMLRTDGETYAELRMTDGRACRIDLTRKEGQHYIGDIPEWECFDDLQYAG